LAPGGQTVAARRRSHVPRGSFEKLSRRSTTAIVASHIDRRFRRNDRTKERPFDVKRAVISDIHSNLEGLQAVLADIASQGIEEIYCLGDIVGYGPNPCECIDLAMQCQICLLGNHDQGALFDPEGFNTGAERAIFWTREQLERPTDEPEKQALRWDFLGELPRNHREEGLLFVHGSPRNPLNEYVFPEDVYNRRKMEKIFSLIDKYCFQGHTHVPGVFTEGMQFLSPDEIDHTYALGDEKIMVNVGSVGQPRDGDPRSCYIVLEDDRLTYRRVEYPIDTTVQKIYDTPELDNFLGDRLREGR
jgi:diadenosine tetraphosphatase ApaH/serine/threonine PP2A family protein phosphatase